ERRRDWRSPHPEPFGEEQVRSLLLLAGGGRGSRSRGGKEHALSLPRVCGLSSLALSLAAASVAAAWPDTASRLRVVPEPEAALQPSSASTAEMCPSEPTYRTAGSPRRPSAGHEATIDQSSSVSTRPPTESRPIRLSSLPVSLARAAESLARLLGRQNCARVQRGEMDRPTRERYETGLTPRRETFPSTGSLVGRHEIVVRPAPRRKNQRAPSWKSGVGHGVTLKRKLDAFRDRSRTRGSGV